MAANRNYSSVARATTLTGSVNGSSTIITVTETTGFPTAPFTLVIDPARTVEEAVTVTAVVGLSLTVTRGVDGTAASPHDAGATVRHMATARDWREPAEHINATENIHGVTGGLVGLTAPQVLDNKTFTAISTDHTPVVLKNAVVQTSDLLQVQTSAGTTIASVKPSGRFSGPGIDGTSTSTFTAGSAVTTPLIAKGFAAQTAKLFSARDAADIELASIGFDGTLNARSTGVSGNLTVSETADIKDLHTSNTAILQTGNTSNTPLVVQAPSALSAAAVAVKNPAATNVAGVRGETGSFQMFHGGDPANVIPWKIHCGSKSVTIGTGTSSIGTTVDISSYGFTQNPLIILTVRQFEESTLKRRVGATVSDISLTAFDARVFQTEGENVPDNTNYNLYWFAMQMTPGAASG